MLWVQDLALLDLKFGFCMQKSSHGTPPELIWLDSHDFTSIFGFFETFVSKNIVFSLVFEGPGGFRKVREACRKNFFLFSCKSDSMAPPKKRIPQKNKKSIKVCLWASESNSEKIKAFVVFFAVAGRLWISSLKFR